MKISYMLKREDFYAINEQTLIDFFKSKNGKTTLYIYPHLNAIITKNPSKKVKEYIYTEYSINASFIKKVFVYIYTRLCLNSFGLFATKKLILNANISANTLIYPCNRKLRIFDFENNIVSIITKSGFSKNSIHNEIEFRTNNKSNFILPIFDFTEDTYSENIINGTPLARIADKKESFEQKALKLWQDYSKSSKQIVSTSQYADILQQKINSFVQKIIESKPSLDVKSLIRIVERYLKELRSYDESIAIIQSHGDLQAGNIWIENQTEQIYIIDWESVEIRSVWYDVAVLYDDIRKPNKFELFAKTKDIKHTVVLLEEIIYRMNELCELPKDYGIDDFKIFIEKLENLNV